MLYNYSLYVITFISTIILIIYDVCAIGPHRIHQRSSPDLPSGSEQLAKHRGDNSTAFSQSLAIPVAATPSCHMHETSLPQRANFRVGCKVQADVMS